MSNDGLKSMLDEMLVDANRQFAAEKARELEPDPSELPSSTFTDVEQFRALTDAELCKVLALAARDDILTVLSGASNGLRRKILTNLSPASVTWLKQNLEYFDEPTRALLTSGRAQLLIVANRLLDESAIKLPRPPSESAAASAVPDEIERLGEAIASLLQVVQKRGFGALSDMVSADGDPLLTEGVALLVGGADETAIGKALDATSARLMAAYARRLAVAREGVLAIHRGEDPEAFRKRLDGIAK